MIFRESTHEYLNDKQIKYTSMTSLLKSLKPQVNWNKIAEAYLNKHKTVENVLKDIAKKRDIDIDEAYEKWGVDVPTVEWIKYIWKDQSNIALERGSLYHAEREVALSKQENVIYNPIKNDIKSSTDLTKLQRGFIYPELICYDHKNKISGQADYVKITESGHCVIRDYKGLALDTPIYTDNGWSTMGKVKVGDKVLDRDGELTEIEHVSEIHYNPCYKITFDTGDTIIADHEHKWVINYSTQNKKKPFKEETLTTEELFFKEIRNRKNSHKIPKILVQGNNNIDDIDLPIDPYVLGNWLGDGDKSSGGITCVNEKVWREIEKRGYDIGHDISGNIHNRAEKRTIYGLRTKLKELNILYNKDIPDIYFKASYAQRLDLLRGFMDSDGHYNKTRKRFVATTTQKWQAESFVKLVASLGFKPTLINTYTYCTNCEDTLHKPSFDVCFYMDINPFLCRNENCILDITNKQKTIQHHYRVIKKIEKVKTVPTKCIAVKSDTHTYLVGHGLICTHNTSRTIDTEPKAFYDQKLKRKVVKRFLSPISHLAIFNLNEYALQLSGYAYILEQNGFPPLHDKEGRSSLIIEHIIFDKEGNYQESVDYNVPYLRKEIKAIFEYSRLNNI